MFFLELVVKIQVLIVLMTRVGRDFGDTMQEAVQPVSTDVSFSSNHFPKYKIGANDQILEAKEDPEVPTMKDIVAEETARLLEQQRRLSVRDLASKFEKGLAAATKLSDEVCVSDFHASSEFQILFLLVFF